MASAFALAIFSGIGFLFGIQKSLRAFLNPLFTSRVVTENGICSVLALSGRFASSSPEGRAFIGTENFSYSRQKLPLSGELAKPSGFD